MQNLQKHRKREAERARSPNPVGASGVGSMSAASKVNGFLIFSLF